ncbi:MAG: MBL fold metallo-hydrolase [Verrucomicrobiota bacterium]
MALEDNFADVLGKAQRGLALADSEVVARAGVSAAEFQRVHEEQFNPAVIRKLAPVLGLNAQALVELPQYQPTPVALDGLTAFHSHYGEMLVNSYLIWDSEAAEAVAFDTGTDSKPMLEFLRDHGLTLRCILLTHTHGDHVYDLDRLRERTGSRAYVSNREPLRGAEGFDAGQEFACGKLLIETRLTWGHSRGGTTYVVHGLKRPVAVVGDALFAGSMGGGMASYADALRTNREQILTLPSEAVLCPGHGPLTTVAEERLHNPFFA